MPNQFLVTRIVTKLAKSDGFVLESRRACQRECGLIAMLAGRVNGGTTNRRVESMWRLIPLVRDIRSRCLGGDPRDDFHHPPVHVTQHLRV